MWLSRRSEAKEIMDSGFIPFEDYRAYLADLARVNRMTLAHAPIMTWLDRAVRDVPSGVPLTILDIGYGYGDLLRRIRIWGRARERKLNLIGIDLNADSEAIARAVTPAAFSIDYRTGDVLHFTPGRRIDYIVCSQTAHHLSEHELVRLVAWMDRVAARGWIVADLQRHVVSFYGFRLLSRLAGWHRFVQHDGPISIARGFRRADWDAVTRAAHLESSAVTTRWHFPFRLSVSSLQPSRERANANPAPARAEERSAAYRDLADPASQDRNAV